MRDRTGRFDLFFSLDCKTFLYLYLIHRFPLDSMYRHADLLQLKRSGFVLVALALTDNAVECDELPIPGGASPKVALLVGV